MQPLSNSFVHFVDERHYWSVQASCVLYWVRWQLCLVQHDDRKKLKETEIYLDFDGFQVIMSPIVIFKSNQIKSNHFYCHITTAQVPWWVKFLWVCSRQWKKNNNKQFTYGQTVQKKQQTIYIWTDSAKKTTSNLHMDRQCKKTALEHLQCSRQCKKNNNNLHMDSTYLQTVQKTMCKIHIHILSTHSVL